MIEGKGEMGGRKEVEKDMKKGDGKKRGRGTGKRSERYG